MYPEYARDAMTEWVVGHREPDFSLDLDAARDADRGDAARAVVLLPSPNNPTGTALPPGRVSMLCEAVRRRDRRRRRGVRRVPPPRRAERARAAARAPQPRRHPDHEQGVRAGRCAARLPRRGPRDLRRDPGRAAAVPPLRRHPGDRAGRPAARARAAGAASPSCGPSATRTVAWLRAQGLRGGRQSDANFVLFGRFADRHAIWQGLLEPRRADPRDRARRVAAGVDRHRGRR